MEDVLKEEEFDVLFVLGDINSCLLVILVKCWYVFIFYMEVGNCCFDQCVLEEMNWCIVDYMVDVNLIYSDIVCEYFLVEGLLVDCIIKMGSLMFEVFYYY